MGAGSPAGTGDREAGSVLWWRLVSEAWGPACTAGGRAASGRDGRLLKSHLLVRVPPATQRGRGDPSSGYFLSNRRQTWPPASRGGFHTLTCQPRKEARDPAVTADGAT